jgi:hypothetical protein
MRGAVAQLVSTAIGLIEQALARARSVQQQCAADAAVLRRLRVLRAWQAQRLARTYEDLHRKPGYRQAVDFFLSDLYGPGEFSGRDTQFERAWPALRRVVPEAVLQLLAAVVELHALTLELDGAMARALPDGDLCAAGYLAAYRAVGRAAQLVQSKWVRLALRAAQLPARTAGFGSLQSFLERGFRAFRAVPDTQGLLRAIGTRERRLMQTLLTGTDVAALEQLSAAGHADG